MRSQYNADRGALSPIEGLLLFLIVLVVLAMGSVFIFGSSGPSKADRAAQRSLDNALTAIQAYQQHISTVARDFSGVECQPRTLPCRETTPARRGLLPADLDAQNHDQAPCGGRAAGFLGCAPAERCSSMVAGRRVGGSASGPPFSTLPAEPAGLASGIAAGEPDAPQRVVPGTCSNRTPPFYHTGELRT